VGEVRDMLLRGSETFSSRQSDSAAMEVKALEWLKIVA
jgi:hypothetical protein